jgi:hypothetical protein
MERKKTSKMTINLKLAPLMSSNYMILFKACSFALLLFVFTNASAQRAERRSIFDSYYSSGDRAELFDHLAAWIECNEGILVYHGDYFGPTHLPQTLFPFHRAHIREIESYLMKQPGGDKFVPLPGWIPNADASYTIPSPFTKDYKGYEVLSSSASASSSRFDPDLYSNTNICSQGSTSIIFADDWDSLYHAPVHLLLGGDFNDIYKNTGIPLFWLFHADCDDVWYRWERECNSLYDVYPADHNDPEIDITTYTTWDEEMLVKGIINVNNGGTLYIDAEAIIRFRDSEYESYQSKIVVNNGGILHINGGKLTGIDRLYSSGSSNGLYYYTSWEGIVVNEGGELIIENGSVIENARAAVQIFGDENDIIIEDSEFKNNRRSIVARNKRNNFVIDANSFLNNSALRDNVWKVSINTGSTLEVETHYDHCIPHGTENHVELINCRSVNVSGNSFTQEYPEQHDHNISTGVFSSDSHVRIIGSNTFEKLWTGVFVYNSGSGPRGIVRVDDNDFENNKYGIHAINSDYLLAEQNEFLIVNPAASKIDEYGQGYDCMPCGMHELMANEDRPGFAIRMSAGSSAFHIRHNNIIGSGETSKTMGILVGGTRTSGHGHVIHNNTLENLNTGIQLGGVHVRIQMPCNTFDIDVASDDQAFLMATDVSSDMPHQGSPLQPTGNELGTTCSLQRQFFAPAYAIEADYYHFDDPSHELQCTTSNIIPVDVGSSMPSGYCDLITTCYPNHWRGCFDDAIEAVYLLESSIAGSLLLTAPEKALEYNVIENTKRALLTEGIHAGLESWEWSEVSDYIEDFSLLIPDFEDDFEVWEVRENSSLIISEEVTYKNYLADSQCAGCDADALLDYINNTGELPASEVLFLDEGMYSPMKESDETFITFSADEIRTENIVYPNPASDILNVELVEDIIDLTIFDLNGKLALRLPNLSAGIHAININNLLPGMYVLKINNLNGNHIPLKLNIR